MKDGSHGQRAKARAMMPGMATGVSNLAQEMTNPRPQSPAMRLTPGPSDKYVRPGTGMKERPIAAYAKGGKVAARMAESRGMEKAEARKEMRADMKQDIATIRKHERDDTKQDKKMVAQGVHKHERHLHKGQPLTKLAKGGAACAPRGKVAKYAAGGAAKYRRDGAPLPPKKPRGGEPVY